MRRLLHNWDIVRVIRLLIGTGFAAYAIYYKEYLFLSLAGLFITQSLLNISCCGVGCSSPSKEVKQQEVYKGQVKRYKQEKSLY